MRRAASWVSLFIEERGRPRSENHPACHAAPGECRGVDRGGLRFLAPVTVPAVPRVRPGFPPAERRTGYPLLPLHTLISQNYFLEFFGKISDKA